MIDTIIYDLGGVLIDWNPMYVYENYFEKESDRNFFFEKVCTSDWNEEQDAGRTIAEANDLLIAQYPDWEQAIRDYYGRWTEMIKGPIKESVDLLADIRATGQYKLYALTNWSAETFPYAMKHFEFLSWFEGILVSGEEKTRKPFKDFYLKLMEKYNINLKTAVFIDDNLRNIEAAQKISLTTIHFRNAQQLLMELRQLGVQI